MKLAFQSLVTEIGTAKSYTQLSKNWFATSYAANHPFPALHGAYSDHMLHLVTMINIVLNPFILGKSVTNSMVQVLNLPLSVVNGCSNP